MECDCTNQEWAVPFFLSQYCIDSASTLLKESRHYKNMGVNLEAIKKAIAIPNFQQTELLKNALTHPSHIYEDLNLTRQQQDEQERQYRRQAILGDSIFNAAVVDYLVDDRFPTLNQGDITNKFKSPIVSRKQHFEFAQELNLRQLCLLGRSTRDKDETEQTELFAEMFEALVGAIYLGFERDFSRTRNWLVERFIKRAVDDLLTDAPLTKNHLAQDTMQEITRMNSTETADRLRQMKREADALVACDQQLQQLLTWIYQKSLSVKSKYKPVKLRAFYLALAHLLGLALIRNFDPKRNKTKARQFATSFPRARDIAVDLAFNLNFNTDPAYVLISVFAQDFEPELKQTLQQLLAELPDPKEQKEEFEAWRQTHGSEWMAKIKNVLGFDLHLSDEQRDLLKDYYKVNKSLVECLNNASNLTPDVREEIETSLLLPVDDGNQSTM
jgi:dsRNA-specific ribonuclease